jgi:hypothetical protein
MLWTVAAAVILAAAPPASAQQVKCIAGKRRESRVIAVHSTS